MSGNSNYDRIYRLTVRQKTKIDQIKASVLYPPARVPDKPLPTWLDIPLEQKLPMLPAPKGEIVFSRGTLGESLLLPRLAYTTIDPLHMQTIPSNNHEPLHEPGTKKFLRKQSELLKFHGLLEDKKVVCSLKEFNRYRLYLDSLCREEVWMKIALMSQYQDFKLRHSKSVVRYEKYQEGVGKLALRNERIERSKMFLLDKEAEKRQKFYEKQEAANIRLERLQNEKQHAQMAKLFDNEAKKQAQQDRIEKMKEDEFAWRKEILHKATLKDMNSVAYKQHVEKNKQILKQQKATKWFNDKILSATERLAREKAIQKDYADEIKTNADIRQKYYEKLRADLPGRIKRMREEKLRIEAIVRKYAMRWLNRVRQRLSKPRDEKHESLWFSPTKHALHDGMKYLYDQSGYEKLDDVVMNILKFKEALKQQLLTEMLEEEEEQWGEE